jgi:DNA-binding response OmpR family regulator
VRILVVEDNRDIAANLGDYLEDRGHTVDYAADGVTGLHLAVVNDFDAIVLDLNLPGMDGLEVCRKLRQEGRKQTPVLMLTARDSLDHKLEGFESGADDYLVKPPSRACWGWPTWSTTSIRSRCAAAASCCSSIRRR